MIFSEYAKFYDLIYKDKPYKKEANFVYKWANKPKTILELGGGTGKHAKYWKNKAQVESIEQSKEMAYLNDCVSYISDIRTFNYYTLPKVDAVFAMFNVVGYADLIYYMNKLPIKKGGYFIFDCWDGGMIETEPPTYNCKTFGNIDRLIVPIITKYSPYLKLQITIVKDNKPILTEDHIVRSYFQDEIEELCRVGNFELWEKKDEKGWTSWYKLKKR